VLCITHLPQIAARADTHFVLTKTVQQGRTVTAVSRLDARGREEELARMIAGARISDEVRSSARELLRRARIESKDSAKGESESARRAKAKVRKR
jgi:DNA repair protein RecN (Recombination protein N)